MILHTISVEDVNDYMYEPTNAVQYARSVIYDDDPAVKYKSNKVFKILLNRFYLVYCFKMQDKLLTSDLNLAVQKYNELP